MSNGITPEAKAILDDLWRKAYSQLWNQPTGTATMVATTTDYQGAQIVYRLYAAVCPVVRFNPATNVHITDDGSNVPLSFAARLGRGGIVRCGFMAGTS